MVRVRRSRSGGWRSGRLCFKFERGFVLMRVIIHHRLSAHITTYWLQGYFGRISQGNVLSASWRVFFELHLLPLYHEI